jgi:hypothetical protein
MAREGSNWEKWTALASLALAVFGGLALVLAWWQIRELRAAAKMQYLDQLVHRWDYEMVEARKGLALRRLDENKKSVRPLDLNDPPTEMVKILNFYEHLDLLVDRGFIDREDVWSEFSADMFPFYADAHSYVDQKQKDSPSTWGGFTDLMEDMRRLEKEWNDGAEDHSDAADILGYYQDEADLEPGSPDVPKKHHQLKNVPQ